MYTRKKKRCPFADQRFETINWLEKEKGILCEKQYASRYDQLAFGIAFAKSMEAYNYLKNKQTICVSPQPYFDCKSIFGNPSINKIWRYTSFFNFYLINKIGTWTYDEYPAKDDKSNDNYNYDTCKKDITNSNSIDISWEQAPDDRVWYNFTKRHLVEALHRGPLTVDIERWIDPLLAGGIYSKPWHCLQNFRFYPLLLVGYAIDAKTGMDYWITTSYFGQKWGNGGYLYLAAGDNDIDSYGVYDHGFVRARHEAN